ncbi:MAG: hypothetical protein H0X29_00210 [Parachlamydiaceae bacterium]|nr:hypothetical protein [Parachlamydiaceae bacterium]
MNKKIKSAKNEISVCQTFPINCPTSYYGHFTIKKSLPIFLKLIIRAVEKLNKGADMKITFSQISSILSQQFSDLRKIVSANKNSQEFEIDELAVKVFVNMEYIAHEIHDAKVFRGGKFCENRAVIVVTPANQPVIKSVIKHFKNLFVPPILAFGAPNTFLIDSVKVNDEEIIAKKSLYFF